MARRGLELLTESIGNVLRTEQAQKQALLREHIEQRFKERMAQKDRLFRAEENRKARQSTRELGEMREDAAMERTKYIQDSLLKRKKLPSLSTVTHISDGGRGGGRDYTVTDVTKLHDDLYGNRLDMVEMALKLELSKKPYFQDQNKIAELRGEYNNLSALGAQFLQSNVGNRIKFPKKEPEIPYYLRRPVPTDKIRWSKYLENAD